MTCFITVVKVVALIACHFAALLVPAEGSVSSPSNCTVALGMENMTIPDSAVTASSFIGGGEPYNARLRLSRGSYTAWRPATNNIWQWIQVNLGTAVYITGIVTQRSATHLYWVLSYHLSYSQDGIFFEEYEKRKVFSGSSNTLGNSAPKIIEPGFVARFVRIHPRSWLSNIAIAMRLELYGCRTGFTIPPPHGCREPLGIENQTIPDGAVTASSYQVGYEPHKARLNNAHASWRAMHQNGLQWLQIDFGKMVKLTGIATQGMPDRSYWVQAYYLTYTPEDIGVFFRSYGNKKVFSGNVDQHNLVTHPLEPSIIARFIRVHPRSFVHFIGMRLELYGCRTGFTAPTAVCKEILGMQNMTIPDSAVTASSFIAGGEPYNARLRLSRGSYTAWRPALQDIWQWIQVDLGTAINITGINTQGSVSKVRWVSQYSLSYSQDGIFFDIYGNKKVFLGNVDKDGLAPNIIEPGFIARYVRVHPHKYNGIAMRLELYGCPRAVRYYLEGGKQSCDEICQKHGSVCTRSYHGFTDATTLAIFRHKGVNCSTDNKTDSYKHHSSPFESTDSPDSGKTCNGWKNVPFMIDCSKKPGKSNITRLCPCVNGSNYPTPHPCRKPLGMENKTILDGSITASSNVQNYKAHKARLNSPSTCWMPSKVNTDQWLMVAFEQHVQVTGIATQGRPDKSNWVLTYYITYSSDGLFFDRLKETFHGNHDRHNFVANKIEPRIIGKQFRVHPLTWSISIALRLELYGCLSGFVPSPPVCRKAVGMENKNIPSALIAASSSDRYGVPQQGRLNYRPKVPKIKGGWVASVLNKLQWLQVDIAIISALTGFATQGRSDGDNWMTTCSIAYSHDGSVWVDYEGKKIFKTNTDRNTIVANILEPMLLTRFIRIKPQSWYGKIALRLELYGCKPISVEAPYNVTAKAKSSTAVEVSWLFKTRWENATGATFGIRIFYKHPDSVSTSSLVIGLVSSTTLRGLRPYTCYSVSVAASLASSHWNSSDWISVDTPEDAPNHPPSDVNANSISSTGITVNWRKVPREYRNGNILGYRVRLAPLSDPSQFTVHNYTAKERSANFSQLLKFSSYTVQVLAFTVVGDGTPSAPVTVTTGQDVPSRPPAIVKAYSLGSTSVRIVWGKVPAEDANGIIIGYYLYMTRVGSNATTFNKKVTARSRQVFGLQEFTVYSVQISAYTVIGPSNLSEPIYVTTAEDVPSSPPTNIRAFNTSSTSLRVEWGEVPPEHRNGIILSYCVYVKEWGTGSKETPDKCVKNARTTHLTGLKMFTEYKVKVTALTVVGQGTLSNPVIVRTAEDVPSAAPYVLAISRSSTSVQIQWHTIPTSYRNGIIIGYRVHLVHSQNSHKAVNRTTDASVREVFINGLEKFTSYYFRVLAFTVKGDGKSSIPSVVTTDEDVPSRAPSNITASAVTSTSILVSWQPLNTEYVHGILLGYNLSYQRSDGNGWDTFTATANETTYLLVRLAKFTEYQVKVLAFTVKGNGNFSNPVLCVTKEDVPSWPPQKVSIAGITPYSISVQWDDVMQSKRNGIIRGYHVFISVSGKQSKTSVTADRKRAILSGLTQYTWHTIQVSAYTSVGPGPRSYRLMQRTADADECLLNIDNCHQYANCTNTLGSFTCSCWPGFLGNGVSCRDIDECSDGFHNCTQDELCINGAGSYICAPKITGKLVNVLDLYSCKPPTIVMTGLGHDVTKPLEIQIRDNVIVETDVELKCDAKIETSFQWKVEEITFAPFSISKEIILEKNGSAEFNIPSRSLYEGYFIVDFEVTLKAATYASFHEVGFIRAYAAPLFATIDGGSFVTRGNAGLITVDASHSFDPDVGADNHQGLQFTWLCKVVNGSSSEEKVDRSVNECFGNGTAELTSKNLALRINASRLTAELLYIMKVTVTETLGTRQASFVQTLKVVKGSPPHISIRCFLNCGKTINPSLKLSLQTECTDNTCGLDETLDYSWELLVVISTSLKGNTTFKTVANFTEITSTGIKSQNLVIKAKKLAAKRRYQLRVNASFPGTSVVGTAMYNFEASVPPSGGQCVVSPNSGETLTTIFRLSCNGWNNHSQSLTYTFSHHLAEDGPTVLSYSPTQFSDVTLPAGSPSHNYSYDITAAIANSVGVSSEFTINVQVLPSSYTSELGNKLLAEINSVLQRGKVHKATQLIAALLKSLDSSEASSEEKRKVKKEVIKSLVLVKVENLQRALQVLPMITMATQGVASDPEIQEFSTSMTAKINKLLTSVEYEDTAALTLVDGAATGIIASTAQVMSSSSTDVKQDSATNTGSADKQQAQAAAEGFHLLNGLGTFLSGSQVVGESALELTTGLMTLSVQRGDPSSINGSEIVSGNVGIKLPDLAETFQSMKNKTKYIDSQMSILKFNPFLWDESAKRMKSDLVNLELKSENGSPLAMSNLTEDFELSIPLATTAKRPNNTNHHFLKPNSPRVHTIPVNYPGSSLQLTFIPEKDFMNATFLFMIKFGKKPAPDDHDYNFTLPDQTKCKILKNQPYVNCSDAAFQMDLKPEFIPKAGRYFFGVLYQVDTNKAKEKHRSRRSCANGGRQKRSCVDIKDPPPTPSSLVEKPYVPVYDPLNDVNYTLKISEISCVFWDAKREIWSTDGCKAGSGTTDTQLKCLCNHLTSFGGSLLVAPNPIDFDNVFAEFGRLDETGNVLVLAVIVAIFLLYLILIVWARRQDKRDIMKFGPPLIVTEELDAYHAYKITFHTGVWINCGTTANVHVIMYGTDGISTELLLKKNLHSDRVLFERGSIDSFVVYIPCDLGQLQCLLIWHDNTGTSPSWFLEHVTVAQIQTKEVWEFPCYRWFALEKDDCEIERFLNVSKTKSLSSFKNNIYLFSKKYLADYHLWFSVVGKSPSSTFTRVQRLSCCLCLLFTTMITNAMFYQLNNKVESAIQVGPFKFTWRQVMVGIQSAVLVIPVNLIIIILFRCTKQKQNVNDAYLREEQKQEKERGGVLPYCFIFIAWFFCIGTALSSAIFTLFYSLEWGKEIADRWLSSNVVSIIQDIFFVQIGIIFLISTAKATQIKLKSKKDQKKTDLFGDSSSQDGTLSFFEDTLPPEVLEYQREQKQKMSRMFAYFKDIFLFLIFVFLLCVVCYGNRSNHAWQMTNALGKAFPKFHKAVDPIKYRYWLERYLVPKIYAGEWYNGKKEKTEEYVADKRSILVGMPSLRQLRVVKGCNKVPRFFTSQDCYPPYSPDTEDYTGGTPGWWSIPTNITQSNFLKLCPKPWRYKTAKDLGNIPLWGYHTLYGGGGYIADLGYNEKTAKGVIKEIFQNNWIDRQTRAVILEFAVFNTNLNLVTIVRFVYESLNTGYAYDFQRIETLSLYPTDSGAYGFYLLCQLLFMVMVTYYLIIWIIQMYRQKCRFFRSLWNWLHLLLLVSSVLATLIYFLKASSILFTVAKIHANPFDNASFHDALAWSEAEDIALAFAIFASTMKLLKLIDFEPKVILLSTALRSSFQLIMSYGIVLFTVFVAFAHFGLLAFGTTMLDYSSFINVCVVQLQMLVGKALSVTNLSTEYPSLGPTYGFLYMFTSLAILTNFFIVILNDSFTDVKAHIDNCREKLEMSQFINKQLAVVLLGKKNRLPERRLYCENIDISYNLSLQCSTNFFQEISEKESDVFKKLDKLLNGLALEEEKDRMEELVLLKFIL